MALQVGWSNQSLAPAWALGLILGAIAGLYVAARLRGFGGEVATATVHHDSRSVRVAVGDQPRLRSGGSPSPPASSVGSDVVDLPLRRGRILE